MEFEEHEEEMGMGGASPVEENQQQQAMMTMRNNTSIKRRYRECLKNHAIGIGGHALDGCGEFLPAGPEGSIDALKCAACNCHRNFHRKETTTFITTAAATGDAFPSFSHRRNQTSPFAACYRTPGGYLHVAGPPRGPPALALPSPTDVGVVVGGPVHNTMEDHDGVVVMDHTNGGGGGSNSKKRFRTKFTPEQKEKMLAFAEKLGWRMQKQDEGVVQEFCNETGVKRQVLKVWMHNNKHNLEDLHLPANAGSDRCAMVKRRFCVEVGRSWEISSLNVSEVVHY